PRKARRTGAFRDRRAERDHPPPGAVPRRSCARSSTGESARPRAGAEAAASCRRGGHVSVRSFVAVEVPESIRTRLAGELAGLRQVTPPARWTLPSSWHLTLAFLGEIEAAEVDEAAARLSQVVAPLAPFELEISGVG